MPLTCPAPDTSAPLMEGLADYLQCHAAKLGEDGYHSVAGGQVVPALLGSCLVIYVALIGYRFLLGHGLTGKEAVLSVLRIGLVLAFCLRWPSYESVFYRVVVDGPVEIAGELLQPAGMPPLSIEELAGRSQAAYDAIQTQGLQAQQARNSARATGVFSPAGLATNSGQETPNANQDGLPSSLSTPAIVFMVSTIGVLLAIRFAAGLLLAVGPLVIALALFDSFLGLFEGWVRALIGVTLGATGLIIVVGLELVFIEAELANATDAVGPLTGNGLLAVAASFAVVIALVLTVASIVARGFRLPRWSHGQSVGGTANPTPVTRAGPLLDSKSNRGDHEWPSRAQAIASAVTSQIRRERRTAASAEPQTYQDRRAAAAMANDAFAGLGAQGLAHSSRRSPSPRRTISVDHRTEVRS